MSNVSGNVTAAAAAAAACEEAACHPHWSRFGDASYAVHASIGLVMTLISVLSIGGNAFVIYVYAKFSVLRSASNLLIINLTVSDLCMAVTGFPLYIIASYNGKWPFSKQVCEFYGFAGGMFGLLSINSLAVISVERYMVIVRHRGIRSSIRRKTAYLMVVCVWVYSCAWAGPPLFGWNRYTWEGYGTTCSFDYLTRTDGSRYFIVAMTVGGFFVPMGVILCSYGAIFRSVIVRRTSYNRETRHMKARIMQGGTQQDKYQVEVDSAKAILLMVGLFCLSWLPYTVVALIGIYGDQSHITPLASSVPGILAKASTLYNPVLYAICLPQFKRHIRALALNVFCGIEGELIIVNNLSAPEGELSSTITTEDDCWPARARARVKDSEETISNPMVHYRRGNPSSAQPGAEAEHVDIVLTRHGRGHGDVMAPGDNEGVVCRPVVRIGCSDDIACTEGGQVAIQLGERTISIDIHKLAVILDEEVSRQLQRELSANINRELSANNPHDIRRVLSANNHQEMRRELSANNHQEMRRELSANNHQDMQPELSANNPQDIRRVLSPNNPQDMRRELSANIHDFLRPALDLTEFVDKSSLIKSRSCQNV